MRQIEKKREPRELSAYKKIKDAVYDGPDFRPVKEKIRLSLLAEQGHLCAYCMKRINENEMKIEHWACQHENSDKQLDYKNLLACCKGHEGSALKEQTCDTRKGGRDLKLSPATPTHRINNLINYDNKGTIKSNDIDFNSQLNVILNLNTSRLKSNRLKVLDKIREILHENRGNRKVNEIQKLLDIYTQKSSKGTYFEYYGIVINYLEKKIARG
ncbi:TIGR02646 family protein [Pantoea agglomerans]|uniref:TIGR02646 family protein n=1 Tax=Enterobacter agglomerans TaxID=549 RepID=UPI002F91E97E